MVDGLRAGALAVGPDGHVCDANRGAAQILRMSIEDLRGARIEDVLAPLEDLRPVLSTDPGERVELSLRLRDGREATVGCSLSEILRGDHRGFVVLFQDISSHVQVRRERDRLLQFAAVADALPSILHELRNPLASVTSTLEVLVEEVDGGHQEDLNAALGEIRRIGLCLQGMGGLQADLHGKSLEAIDVAIREASRIMRSSGDDRGVDVRCEVTDLPPLPLRGAVVRGIVFHLLRNAIDACANSGEVRLTAGLDPSRRSLVLAVRDNGRGMTEAEIRHCCDIFYTTKEHGSGVGLPICKQVVERAGGALRVASKLGEGTEVKVEVPIAAPGSG
jgi:two-component system sensor histidine kinase HydH